MKKIGVIGLNNFGKEIAREFTSCGARVLAIDKNEKKIDQISLDVDTTLLLNGLEISKLMKVKFDTYNAIGVVMAENMDLSIAVLILFTSLKINDVIICAENEDQEKMARIFLKGNNWSICRLDKLIADYVKNLMEYIENKENLPGKTTDAH